MVFFPQQNSQAIKPALFFSSPMNRRSPTNAAYRNRPYTSPNLCPNSNRSHGNGQTYCLCLAPPGSAGRNKTDASVSWHRGAMLRSYEPKRHTVVTKDLLLGLANEQQSKRRRRRTLAKLDVVHEIRLEYLSERWLFVFFIFILVCCVDAWTCWACRLFWSFTVVWFFFFIIISLILCMLFREIYWPFWGNCFAHCLRGSKYQ